MYSTEMAVAIALMALAFTIVCFNRTILVGSICGIAAAVNLIICVNAMQISFVVSTVSFIAAFVALYIFKIFLSVYGKISIPKKKSLLISIATYIALMLLLVALTW